jgi:hypothetical protein
MTRIGSAKKEKTGNPSEGTLAAAPTCVHQRASVVELSQLDGCEPESFGQGRHGSDRVLVVAPQKDEAATLPRLRELISL